MEKRCRHFIPLFLFWFGFKPLFLRKELIYWYILDWPKYYKVSQLILMHFRWTFFHDLMTLYSKVNDFWDSEIGRFDMKHYFFTSLTSHGLHDLRKKRYKIFEEMWAWGLHGYATPFSLRLKVAEYQGFHMRYTSLLY